jgi:mono/diheme cytochrome c family protein
MNGRPALLLIAVLALPGPAPAADGPIDFAHDVLPTLRQRCAACHTNGNYKGELSMDTREALLKAEGVVVPGKAAESELIARITESDPELRMPPKGPPLSAQQAESLRKWIDAGAPWQEGFNFAKAGSGLPVKPRRPELPPARDGVSHPIDRIVDAYFAGKKVTPPAPIDDATFARRATLDLVGLLPTPEQLDAFLKDESKGKRDRLVAALLADDQGYTEHWLTFWNDLLRNDYAGTGFIDGGRKAISAWLYDALKTNKPYDDFVRELVSPTPESEGFIKGIKWRGVVNASQVPEVQFAQNVGQVFLGINLKCASCHDSFIDSWKLTDAYGLAAVIAEGPLEINRCDKPTGQVAKAAFLFPEIGSIDPSQPRAERLRRTAELLTSPENGLLARTVVNRLWHRLMGRGIVHPVDVMGNEPWSADLLDFLAADLADHGHDLKRTLGLIATSRAYQSRAVILEGEPPAFDFTFAGPIARRLTAEQFADAVWRLTGTAPTKANLEVKGRKAEPVRASLVVADALMRSLGRPNREQVVSTRPDDLSTLQALDLTNGPEFVALLDQGAKGLLNRPEAKDADALVAWLFTSALGRAPTETERAEGRAILGSPATEASASDLLWTVLMLPEFQMIR